MNKQQRSNLTASTINQAVGIMLTASTFSFINKFARKFEQDKTKRSDLLQQFWLALIEKKHCNLKTEKFLYCFNYDNFNLTKSYCWTVLNNYHRTANNKIESKKRIEKRYKKKIIKEAPTDIFADPEQPINPYKDQTINKIYEYLSYKKKLSIVDLFETYLITEIYLKKRKIKDVCTETKINHVVMNRLLKKNMKKLKSYLVENLDKDNKYKHYIENE